MNEFYQVEAEKVLNELNSTEVDGLPNLEAAARLEEHGFNELVETGKKSPWRIIWEQMTSIMVVIPSLGFFFLVQRRIGAGMTAGAIKG